MASAGAQRPLHQHFGSVIVSCEHADLRPLPHGVMIYADDKRWLDPLPAPVDLIVANLPYLPESEHDGRYDEEPHDAVYAPGDGLGPYRRLLDACHDGKLERAHPKRTRVRHRAMRVDNDASWYGIISPRCAD